MHRKVIRHDFTSSTMAWGTITFAIIYPATYSGQLLKAIIQESSSLLKNAPTVQLWHKNIVIYQWLPDYHDAGTGCFQISSEMFALLLYFNKKIQNQQQNPKQIEQNPHNPLKTTTVLFLWNKEANKKYFSNILHEEKFLVLKFLLKRLFWFCNFYTPKDSHFWGPLKTLNVVS